MAEQLTVATLCVQKWDSYDVEDENVYLPQRNIAHFKPGNKKAWQPGTGKRGDCIPLDMVRCLESRSCLD